MNASRHLSSTVLALALGFSLARPADPAKTPEAGVARLVLVEDFESTPLGEIPKGFTKTGAVGVTDETAHWGKKCLRIEPAVRGARKITKKGPELSALGGEHWGRLYLKVKQPTPVPVPPPGQTFAVIHSTMVDGTGTSPLFHDPIDVQLVSSLTGPQGTSNYVYNVQARSRKELSKGTKFIYHYSDDWTLVEWHVDYATQTYQLFLNGEEITGASVSKGAGHFEGADIPEVFDALSFGWTNFQAAPEGESFTAWIDDIALGKERIGGKNVAKLAPAGS